MPIHSDVLLGLGSNLGDRRRTLDGAWCELSRTPDTETVQISRFRETEPVGGPEGQSSYLNAVGLIRTKLEPESLLAVLHEIERKFGRVRKERWEARTLDLDILLFGDRIVSTPTLSIPHPEMLKRNFVMEPAVEIAADFLCPLTGRTLGALYRSRHGR